MRFKHGAAMTVDLAEGDGTETSGSFEPEAKAADSAEEIEDTH